MMMQTVFISKRFLAADIFLIRKIHLLVTLFMCLSFSDVGPYENPDSSPLTQHEFDHHPAQCLENLVISEAGVW